MGRTFLRDNGSNVGLLCRCLTLLLALGLGSAFAQGQPSMPGMPHHHMPGMNMGVMNQAGMFLMNEASGTSRNPAAWPMPMITRTVGQWTLMFMGQGFLVATQQSGPRGAGKLYSTNWVMFAAQHNLGKGAIEIRMMNSLEPATITSRQYPLLFQTGETAFGVPIVDGQHPHDFFMGLSVEYARPLGDGTTLSAYYAPVGDPALGPVAYPHRASAMELPQAPLGHHWQDSTHISNQVVTVGIQHRRVRLEASGFHGMEPNENRWNIDYGGIDSWAARLSFYPTANWAAQVSLGRLAHPERQEPGDVLRSTASLEYVKPMGGRTSWATSLIWGRNHNTFTHRDTNSYLLETELPIRRRNFLTGRIELVDKDELFAGSPEIEETLDRTAGSTFRIAAFTAGYTRDVRLIPYLETGFGTNVSAYRVPRAIQPYYGEHPFGVNIYLRVRLRKE